MIWALSNIRLIAAGAAILAIAFFVWHYKATLEENTRLNIELQAANRTIALQDAKAESENAITDNSNQLIREVRNAPETDDAGVAPVLERAIAGLHQANR